MLIQSLKNPNLYDHPTEKFELIETHISWVLLTGPTAYKIKKAVDLGFLDFTTLEARYFYCNEELRLNKRLAPELYLDVISITGSPDAPQINGSGPVIEYAVKMKQFPQEARLDRVLERGELKTHHIDELAHLLANFHETCGAVGKETPFGRPEKIYQPVQECFEQMDRIIDDKKDLACLHQIKSWAESEYARLQSIMKDRRECGFIRECHGDVHLANMTLYEGRIVLFDCIEFNENLRWIDVMSEVAFAVMDLEDRHVPNFANRLLNLYLEQTGDYGGLRLLRFFQVYRALVRAKVACIRLHQEGLSQQEKDSVSKQYREYFKLAKQYTEPHPPRLIITHGVSGTGKTTLTQTLLETLGAVRLRTDIERKRHFGIKPHQKSSIELKEQLYNDQTTQTIYKKLASLAEVGLRSGYTMIVDGTFLRREQRQLFRQLSQRLKVPFSILTCQAQESTLRQRIVTRAAHDKDASEADLAVLDKQLSSQEALDESELSDLFKLIQ